MKTRANDCFPADQYDPAILLVADIIGCDLNYIEKEGLLRKDGAVERF